MPITQKVRIELPVFGYPIRIYLYSTVFFAPAYGPNNNTRNVSFGTVPKRKDTHPKTYDFPSPSVSKMIPKRKNRD